MSESLTDQLNREIVDLAPNFKREYIQRFQKWKDVYAKIALTRYRHCLKKMKDMTERLHVDTKTAHSLLPNFENVTLILTLLRFSAFSR